jgi:outer membrane protein assembly factor BamB
MAFNSANLSALSYANGFTLWHYRTEEASTAVDNTGYFNQASGILRVGDFILANCNVAATPSNGVFVVVSNAGGVVDTSDMSLFGPNDTD